MRMKPRIWLVLSLLFFAGGVCLWQAGNRVAASRHALPPVLNPLVSSVPSVPSVGSVGSAGAAGGSGKAGGSPSSLSYRLSNTPESAESLARNAHGLVLRNALIDTARPVRLAIPEGLKSRGAPGSYLV